MRILLISLTLCLSATITTHAEERQQSCITSAQHWIDQLGDEKNQDIYQNHAASTCRFSGHWVKDARDVTHASQRTRMCTDLVLIWSHKECNFFRDIINPDAASPCKNWSREMFRHCMDNDVDWFP